MSPLGPQPIVEDGPINESQLPASVVSGSPTGGVPAWVKEVQCNLNELRTNGGATYICKTAHKSAATFSADETNWQLVGSGSLTLAAEVVKTVAASEEAQTIVLAEGTIWKIGLNKNCTLTFPTPEAGKFFTLELVQASGGSHTVTWPSSTRWSGGVFPLLSTAEGAIDTLSFVCIDGEHWLGFFDGKAMAAGGSEEGIAPAVQTALNLKREGQGVSGLILPNFDLPCASGTLQPTTNQAFYLRFVAPYTGFPCKSVNVVTTEAATKNDLACAALFAADGVTVLATSGSVASKMNAAAGTQNLAFESTYNGTVGGTVYYLAFQYQIVESGTAAKLAASSFANSKMAALVAGTAGSILQALVTPTFPFATQPEIGTHVTTSVPFMYLKST